MYYRIGTPPLMNTIKHTTENIIFPRTAYGTITKGKSEISMPKSQLFNQINLTKYFTVGSLTLDLKLAINLLLLPIKAASITKRDTLNFLQEQLHSPNVKKY